MTTVKKIVLAALILTGLAAVFIGFFAYTIGLDNNPVMGQKRKLLVGIGIMLLLIWPFTSVCKHYFQKWGVFSGYARIREAFLCSRFSRWCQQHEQNRVCRFFEDHAWIWIVIASVLITLTGVWYLTAGTMTTWTEYSHYYDMQADAFLAGKLELLQDPPEALTQIEDIYNWKARQGIDYLWDASYYNGKYYLYWGPAPALMAAGIKWIHPGVVEDQILVLIFLCALSIVVGVFIHWLRKIYFPSTASIMILLVTLTTLFSTPFWWLINRPSVYEAAIAAAQFFLILGIYAAIRGMNSTHKKEGWLILSGFCLGACVGSRFSCVFTVVIVCVITGLKFLMDLIRKKGKWLPIISFCLPVILLAGSIAWFNYARFGDITETGMRFQLTGEALPEGRNHYFQTGYIAPNAYSSLFRPLAKTPGQFPFLTTPFILDHMWPNWIHRPKSYYSGEPVAGVFAVIPYLWLLALLPVFALVRFWRWTKETPKPVPDKTRMNGWSIGLIISATGVQLMTTLSFVMATMRYLCDFVPLLIISTTILVLYAAKLLKDHFWSQELFYLLVTILCLASMAVGLLVNMQGADKRFEVNNPALYSEIADLFIK